MVRDAALCLYLIIKKRTFRREVKPHCPLVLHALFPLTRYAQNAQPNKGIRAELKGRLQGVLEFEIQKSNHDWELRYTLKCRGSTPFWHLYYFAGCYIPHGPYMKYRLNKLRNYAIEERGFYGEAD